MKNLVSLLDTLSSVKVAVIGDVMLDSYLWGHVERISPEAPVPIVSLDKKDHRIGGAANVALNCKSLGANVTLFSVTGEDDDAARLEGMLVEQGIDTSGIIRSGSRITTNKTRIISRNQQVLRVDNEQTNDLSEAEEITLLHKLAEYIKKEKPSVVIFEDYNKGVLTERVIKDAIKLCRDNKVTTAVDPKRKNFFAYKGVDIFKPNLKEVKEGLNLLMDHVDIYSLREIHTALHAKLGQEISLITLSEHGVFYQYGDSADIIGSHIRNIADVSGAGDTVIAVAALAYAITKDPEFAAAVANIAGGLVCEEVGTVAIDKERLVEECLLLLG